LHDIEGQRILRAWIANVSTLLGRKKIEK
jgi:hypothetical protein